jgi:penicillin amidase/acyl-homoserine-lactone acylase
MTLRGFWKRRSVRIALGVLCVLVIWPVVRMQFFRAVPTRPDAATFQQAQRVRILRDSYGVPHVFGHSDADAAFGAAYANAEDDFGTVQDIFAAARGKLGLLHLSKLALQNDYYVQLVRVEEQLDAGYTRLPEDVRSVLDGYARGLNLYAYLHPKEADGRLFPMTGRDIAAGFLHKLPLMLGFPIALAELDKDEPKHVGSKLAMRSDDGFEQLIGSNAHAVLGSRSSDGVTRLNVNSHQPWEGPVAWYEMQIASTEGWNMTGGTFPGAPFILHGHNDTLGWAHTVNHPDVVDVYELVRDGATGYRYDGGVHQLESRQAELPLDIGFFTLTLHKEVLWAEQGPAFETKHGTYALRYAGIERGLVAIEQWFRMNKAKNLDEWKAAMALQGIPMFNTVYADRSHVYYLYNALMGKRPEGFDYHQVLPGDRSDVVWREYMSFVDLPQVENPPSGYVHSCNGSPFTAAGPIGSPQDHYSATFGIDHQDWNRTFRTLMLLGGEGKITPEAFAKMKFDRAYDKRSTMYTHVLDPLLATFVPKTPDETRAIQLLREWDGDCAPGSAAATIAILTYKSVDPEIRGEGDPHIDDPAAGLRDTLAWLKSGYGSIEVPLENVQRLRRGALDLGVAGGPDVMAALYATREKKKLLGTQGDSYILMVDFDEAGAHSRAISNYGASNRKDSPHYADQAPLFVRQELRPVWRTEADIRQHLDREYHPGE